MTKPSMNKRSWESLSSTFSNLDISISQDSCYASDEISGTSTTPAAAKTSTQAPVAPTIEPPLRTFLKPILKRPYAEIEEDEESESGYASDDASEYDEYILSDSDESDDEMYYVTAWEDGDECMSDSCEEEDDSFDGSFISFSSNVRFDPNVVYIEPSFPLEDETPNAGMTCHELMELARSSGSLQFEEEQCAGDGDHEYICDTIKQLPQEHTGDVVDLDKELFIGYMNGINGVVDPGYKSRLRARVEDIKLGHVQSPYLESDGANRAYVDHALTHVIGTFRNIVAKEEFDELVSLSEEKRALPAPSSDINQILLKKIENLLLERMASDVSIGPDELTFFAGGVAYSLEHWRPYVCH